MKEYHYVISAITTRVVQADSEDEAFEKVCEMDIDYGELDDACFDLVETKEE
jgi:hypothetical protein